MTISNIYSHPSMLFIAKTNNFSVSKIAHSISLYVCSITVIMWALITTAREVDEIRRERDHYCSLVQHN